MSILVKINTNAPDPRMHPNAAPLFNQLREDVFEGCEVDFLRECGDVLRPAGFVSNKDGVAGRSWHKTGRAFDYDQTSAALVVSSEEISGKQFFRTYLVCARPDGSLGTLLKVKDYRGHSVHTYLFDFTAAAEALGWERIPAWNGWRNNYNRREFWHYQFDQGLTWAAAMADLSSSKPASVAKAQAVLGLNDRGPRVRELQAALNKRGFLPAERIDGVFGAITKAAVEQMQRASRLLTADGIVGPLTLQALGL